MYVGHSWEHRNLEGLNFSTALTSGGQNMSSPAEELPSPSYFADSEKNTVINNSQGPSGATTIGFHSETLVVGLLMFVAICLVAGILYAYQRVKSLKKKVKILKEELAEQRGDRRRGRRSNS